jgi:hypothetical protein
MLYYNRVRGENRPYVENKSYEENRPYSENRLYVENDEIKSLRQTINDLIENRKSNRVEYNIVSELAPIFYPSETNQLLQRILIVLYIILILLIIK